MICYICNCECRKPQSLVIHFKVFHLLGPDSSYDYCEDSCFQSFQSLCSFKRHVKNKHFKYPSIITVPIQNNFNHINTEPTNDNHILLDGKPNQHDIIRVLL